MHEELTTHQKLVALYDEVDRLSGSLSRVPFAEDPKTECLLVTHDLAQAWVAITELENTRANRENRDMLLSAIAAAANGVEA